MMETNFTKIRKVMQWTVVFALAIFTQFSANAQSCACKGSIQVSLGSDGTAEVTSSMLLADNTTCGASGTPVVAVMTTPTGAPIEISPFVDCNYLGKTLYGKVTNGNNSCWTTITVEDKMAPTLTCPVAPLSVTCADFESYTPTVTDNCPGGLVVNQVGEDVEVLMEPCSTATNVLKRVTRRYQAEDASGNKSAICSFTFDITTIISLANIVMPAANTPLECEGPYAKIPTGQPFAGNPSPIHVGTALGTGVPYLPVGNYGEWVGTTFNAGVVRTFSNRLVLRGGTNTALPNTRQLGATFCYTAEADGNITFDWSADMNRSGGNFNNDEPAYSINGTSVNLATGAINSTSGSQMIPVKVGDAVCFQVFTMNRAAHTRLEITNLTVPKPLFPSLGNDPCKLYVRFTDSPPIPNGCTTKIMREWVVNEWSCLNRVPRTFIQTIEISDTKAPTAPKMVDITASTANHRCEGFVTFPNPNATDNCSLPTQITSSINIFENGDYNKPAGFLRHPDRTATLPVGSHKAIYIIEDACGRAKRDTINVTIIDNTPPVAIANDLTTVGLTLDGQAHVAATSIDDGSYDECQLAKLVVRRMDHTNCQPCDIPTLPGFTYLGTHGEGVLQRYFYLSAHTATAQVAQKTAVAVGGALVNYNSTPAKMSAVRGFVNGVFRNSLFFIHGVNVDHSTGMVGHPRPSTATELQRYVIEISDICGFSSHAKFCCSDIPQSPRQANPMVVFRAIDAAGNFNDNMVSVVVQDKIGPRITCPEHMTVNCDFIYDRNNLTKDFGWPVATDNCELLTITTDSIIDIDACGRGHILRNFMVTDQGGRTATCSQRIDFIPQGVMVYNGPTAAEWPDREVMVNGCGNPAAPEFSPDVLGRPIINNGACSLVAAEYNDQVFNFNQQGSPACFKILRRWTVIDWCQRMSTGAGGYRTWTFDQEIKVVDNQAPVFAALAPMVSANTTDAECARGSITLTASATDVCTQVLRWKYSVDAFNNGTFDINVTSSDAGQTHGNTIDASGTYPVGVHRIVYTFEDRCGNVSTREQIFSIINTKQPTGVVLQGLAINLVDMPGMGAMAEIWASDYDPDRKSLHPCGYDLVYSFAEVVKGNNGQMVTVPNMVFNCSQANTRVPVTIWIAGLTPMGDIVQTSVITFMDVQDNNNICDNGRRIIDGSIVTHSGKSVPEVAVYLEGSELMNITNDLGAFAFQDIPLGYEYNITPYKNDNPINGVSTLDLVLIQRHILGLATITDPYLLIAADINKDGRITSSDLTDLRRLILGSLDNFSNNNSWRFVDKSYFFHNNENAQGEAFPETYFIDANTGNMTTDFVAIKVGDINGNVEANANDKSIEPRSKNEVSLYTENVTFVSGESVVIPVRMSNNLALSGMQLTFDFDASNLSLSNISPKSININDANFGFRNLADGQLSFSWNGNENAELVSDDVLFELTFIAKNDGELTGNLDVTSSITKAEAYDNENKVMNVRWNLRNINDSASFTLYQNTPNPFQGTTTIAFELPFDGPATLSIHDVTGRTVKTLNVSGQKGYNSLQLDVNELSTGVMYYTLQAGVHTATKKMVIIE